MATRKPKSPETFDLMAQKIEQAAEVMKAMASETRLKVLCALDQREIAVHQLAAMTEQSSSVVSQHLAKLRAASLVEQRREGQTIYYRCAGGIGRDLVDTLCRYYG